MVGEEVITFDEYYDLFIRSPLDRRNPWMLVKYYLSTDKMVEFKNVDKESVSCYRQDYKDRVVNVGTNIYDNYLADKGRARFVKFLGRLASGDIHRNWLLSQFETLANDDKDFEYNENWNALCKNEHGEEDVYQLLYLFRLLWTAFINK
jgi:hypothetical protein